jgi:hypothetical protein
MAATEKLTILVAPLDWGLGHASRCIPIIRHYVEEGHHVLLAGNGRSAEMLRLEFPSLTLLTDIPDYQVQYPEDDHFAWHFFKNAWRLLKVIRSENRWLKKKLSTLKIDWIISDNRYGLYHQNARTIFITHQLFIQGPPVLKQLVNFVNHTFIRRYDVCLVPDFAGENNLSGDLSHGTTKPKNVKYIGPLSRFGTFRGIPGEDVLYAQQAPLRQHAPQEIEHEFVLIISGPEPSRTKFRDLLAGIFSQSGKKSMLIEGRTESTELREAGSLRIVSHLSPTEFQHALITGKCVICRSGYSTIMDLWYLGIQAILVPTPGQTEQLYLARLHQRLNNHFCMQQDELSLNSINKLLSAQLK